MNMALTESSLNTTRSCFLKPPPSSDLSSLSAFSRFELCFQGGSTFYYSGKSFLVLKVLKYDTVSGETTFFFRFSVFSVCFCFGSYTTTIINFISSEESCLNSASHQ